MDNASQDAAENGRVREEEFALGVRMAGNAQIPRSGKAFPPDSQMIDIALTRAQWQFAVDDAKANRPIYIELGDAVSAQLCVDEIAAIEPGLS